MDLEKKNVGENSLLALSSEEGEETFNDSASSKNQIPSKNAEAIPRGDSDHASDDDVELGIENDSVDDDASDSEDISDQENEPAIALPTKKAPGPASKTGKRQAIIKRQRKTTTHGTKLDQDMEDHQTREDLPRTKDAPGPSSETKGRVATTKPRKTVATKGGKLKKVVSKGMESHSDDEDSKPSHVPETKTSAKGRKPRLQKGKPKVDSNSESELSQKSTAADEEDTEDSQVETKTSPKGRKLGVQKGKQKVDSNSKKSAAATNKSKVVATKRKGELPNKPVRSESEDEPQTVPKMKPKPAIKLLKDKPTTTTSKSENPKPKDVAPSGSKLRGRLAKNKPSKTESSGDEAKGHESPIKKNAAKSGSRRDVKTVPTKSESDEEQVEEQSTEKRSKKGSSIKSKSRTALIKKRLSSTRLSVSMAVENKKRPTTKDMVLAAVTALQTGRSPVSLSAIKKFVYDTYQVSPSNLIKKAVLKALENGELVQKTGTGASGSFKLGKMVKKDTVSSKKRKEEGLAKPPPKPKTASATASTKTEKPLKKAK